MREMGESLTHIRLVDALSLWIVETYLDGDSGYIMVDGPNSSRNDRPPKIGGFVPDVFVPNGPGGRLIIGEAKTTQDLERKHSLEQIETFLHRCGQVQNSCFLLAVPWHTVRLAESIVRQLRVRAGAENVSTEVLKKLAG